MAAHLGLSPSSAHAALLRLEAAGLAQHQQRSPRTAHLTMSGEILAAALLAHIKDEPRLRIANPQG